MIPLLAAFLGGWEIVLVIAIIVVLLGVRKLPELGKGLMFGLGEFKRAVQEILDSFQNAPKFHQPDYRGEPRERNPPSRGSFLVLWIAQGFGAGRVPFAPGTFGSLVGLLWFALLVWMGNFWAYLAASIEGIALSIWLCDEAERILRQKDPGSIVLDEIVAIPFCFLPWVMAEWLQRGHAMAPLEAFFSGRAWISTLIIVALFRVFDIWKPWPIRALQRLPGGWGVTVDDLLAAGYVALLTLFFVL